MDALMERMLGPDLEVPKELESNSGQFWAEIKDKFLSKELQESFEILEKIMSNIR